MVEDPIDLELVNTPLRREVKWVSPSGTPSSDGMTSTAKLWEDIEKVLAGGVSPLENLSLRHPDSFRAGEVYAYQELWNKISAGYVKEVEVNEWISKGIDITAFCRPFKGVFNGVEYECPTPPPKTFKNHPSCKQFVNFISETLSQRLKTGAVAVWGKVGEVQPSNHCGAIQTQIVH